MHEGPAAPIPGLPSLAGLCSVDAAQAPALPVGDVVARLKRLHFATRRVHGLLLSRLPAEPVYELKMLFSHHAYLCAELTATLRTRVAEMREPPLGLDDPPPAALAQAFDEVASAPDGTHVCLGLYEVLLPAIDEGFERLAADVHPLADAPTARLCRHARLDLADMRTSGVQAAEACAATLPAHPAPWLDELRAALEAVGGLDGVRPPAGDAPPPRYAATPRPFDPVPRRDARFADPYNMAVNAEAFLYEPTYPATPKLLMLAYKRLREIDVPEMMASIIVETPGKPWAYSLDMTRQLWDEARHAMMGEVLFAALGVDWPREVPINFTWSLGLNTQLTPLERHAVLYFIEQGLMPKHGKRYEWEVAQQTDLPLAATFQDYDWADEVLHARIGRQWYVADMPSHTEALRHGDRCWSKVLMGWESWRDAGLTAHANWWPALYRAACARHGWPVDPTVEAFDTSYAEQRADLKSVSHPA